MAFKKAARGLRGQNPQDLDDEGWWVLGRHYGLITPLLDWTEKPYIAAFFALTGLYEEYRKNPYGGLAFTGKKVAVYKLFRNEQLEDTNLKIIEKLPDELGRAQGQRSVFTYLDSEDYFELQGYLDNTGRGNHLTQIVLSDQALLDGLRDLDQHGIDHRLLFPDLTGAALYANAQYNGLF